MTGAAVKRLETGVLAGDRDSGVAVLQLAWPDCDPPQWWWGTPLGAATAFATAPDGRLDISVAAAVLGVTPTAIGSDLEAGRLARHPDGGLTAESVRALAWGLEAEDLERARPDEGAASRASAPKDRSVTLQDGRTLHATQPGRLDPWTVWIDGDKGGAVSDRWLLGLLCRALGLGPGRAPDYVFTLVAEILGTATYRGTRYPCPCCDLLTLQRVDSHDTCRVCGWEDDLAQYCDPDYTGGANKPSLRASRAQYAARGYSCDQLHRAGLLRGPLTSEIPAEIRT